MAVEWNKKGGQQSKMSRKRPLNFLDTEFWVGEMGGTQSRKHQHAVLHIQAIPITKDHQILIIALAAAIIVLAALLQRQLWFLAIFFHNSNTRIEDLSSAQI